MLGHRHIYTERIHHITCKKCTKQINTNDYSHEIGKIDAAIWFEEEGWKYIQNKGWLCGDCQATEGTPPQL